jgi:hypothetical protein
MGFAKLSSMVAAIKQTVVVQPGGRVEVRSDQLKEGSTAEVIVLVDAQPPAQHRSLSSFIGSAKGSFKSGAEIDTYVRELRDEWDQ